MGQALYRKYRSRSLDEIVGQEHIITALRNALKQGKLSHAYLFTGPRGVGKTSIARILAHDINGLPYTDEHAHIDIIEIDAASNRGIDEIRDLREKVYVAPTSGKYKVYIIDEVHMLTPQAFNALLKTLEEPPAHIVFILATTEVYKLPATIISRTQRYTFRPADPVQLQAHLRHIADEEKIKISDEALALLAEHGDGSFRDSVGLLDQVARSKDKVEVADVHALLGVPPVEAISQLINQIAANDIAAVAGSLQQLQQQGYQAAAIAKELSRLLRNSLLESKPLLRAAQAITILKDLLEVGVSHNPGRYLELVLLEQMSADLTWQRPTVTATLPHQEEPVATKSKVAKPKDEAAPAPIKAEPAVAQPEEPAKEDAEPSNKNTPTPPPVAPEQAADTTASAASAGDDKAHWAETLKALKTEHNTLYGVVRMARPEFLNDKVRLTFGFAFHQKRVNEAKNKAVVSKVLGNVLGHEVELECLFDKNSKPEPVVAAPKAAGGTIDAISNIFGGGELLES